MYKNSQDKIYNEILKALPKNIYNNKSIKNLLIIRASELAFIELSKLGKIRGPLHTSVGQEAVAVSVCLNLKENDGIFSNHRGHGHYIAKSGNLSKLILELLGSDKGCCGGKGGSMHVAELEKNIIGSNGIVGAGVPMACGYAYSKKLENSNSITVVFFGDGAMNQGVVMESLNIAAITKLPILFVCENNYYAYSSKSEDMSKTSLHNRAKGFGIESYKLDGMNFSQSFKMMEKITKKIRKKKTPIFVEFETYRYHRHFASEMPRKNDYIDIKKHKIMLNKDPCYVECGKINLNKNKTDIIINSIKDIIVKTGIKWSK
tara:strand:+ start:1361 stop:2314 length:954 start_codon:yes stop_codon:yes gene_type:complete